MSFDIKYDKNGQVIANPETEKRIESEKAAALAQQTDQNLAPVSDSPPSSQSAPSETESTEEPQEPISNEAGPSDVEYQEAAEQAQVVQAKTKQDNLRALREKSERLERERDEYMRQLKEAQASKDDSDLSLGDADLAEGKHLKKLQQEIKKLRQESEVNKQQSQVTQTEVRLKSQYSDFDKVVSADNIAALRESYPELAASINANNDLYSKAVSAYTMIKKLGIHQEQVYAPEKARIAQNAAKPKPSATIAPQKSDSPLSQANAFANGLTPELQKQLWSEMNSLRKNY